MNYFIQLISFRFTNLKWLWTILLLKWAFVWPDSPFYLFLEVFFRFNVAFSFYLKIRVFDIVIHYSQTFFGLIFLKWFWAVKLFYCNASNLFFWNYLLAISLLLWFSFTFFSLSCFTFLFQLSEMNNFVIYFPQILIRNPPENFSCVENATIFIQRIPECLYCRWL